MVDFDLTEVPMSFYRTPEQEVMQRCSIIENQLFTLVDEKAIAVIGQGRREALPPLDVSKNILGKLVSILGRILRPTPAVSGLDPRLSLLLGDSASSATIARYAKIGHVPLPTSLLRGTGKYGGLIRGARYLHGVGYSAQLVDWSTSLKRPYCMTVRPCDFDVITDQDDPSHQIGYLHRRSRKDREGQIRQVTDYWDLHDLDRPVKTVLAGHVYPVDGFIPKVEDVSADFGGQLTGDRYWWRYSDRRPWSPLVVYGTASELWDLTHLASASLQAVVYRLCLAGVFVDSGFPVENVENLTTPTTNDSSSAKTGAQNHSDVNRGDIRRWGKVNEAESSNHWTTPAGDKPKDLLDAILAYEADVADQVGVPLRTESSGGEPMAVAVAAQEEEIGAKADIHRSGDSVLLRRLAAAANRAGESGYLEGWTSVSEDLPGVLYRSEIAEALNETQESPTPGEKDGEEGK